MKRTFFISLFLFVIVSILWAQPTQAELDKMMKQAQELIKKYGSDSTMNKTLKSLPDEQKQLVSTTKNSPKGKDTAVFSLPSRNNKLLNSLPVRTFTRGRTGFLPELKLVADASEVKYSVGVEEGLTAGVGSGVQIKEGGQLKAFIDKTYAVQPGAKQINKNVPLYKK